MEQETLEEAAEKHRYGDNYENFIRGAKWQAQRMQSEEEVYELMIKAFNAGFNKYESVEAGLEGKEADLECANILANENEYCKHDIISAYNKGYAQCQEDMYEFGKLVLDTFHSEGKTHSGKDRLARVKFDEWFKQLNKQD